MSEPGDLRITIGFYFCMVTTCACIWWSALLAEGVRLPMGRESLLCDLRMRPCLQFLRCASVFCLRERACLASNTLQTPTSCAPFVGAYNCECSFCKQGASRGHACLARALQVISLVGRHDVLHVYLDYASTWSPTGRRYLHPFPKYRSDFDWWCIGTRASVCKPTRTCVGPRSFA
jgi:hypothetical protein